MKRLCLALWMAIALGAGASAQTPPAATPAPTAAQSPQAFEYRLGAGDKVRIIVFGEESLSGEFLVPGGTGTISFPLIGEVKAGGLSLAELRAELEAELRNGFLKEPRVSIEVLNYRPYYILGEVGKPGEYPYIVGLTVLNAVATASGFTYRADTRKVYIRRANSSSESVSKLETTTPVEPGDTIRIGERFF
ncbi:MAG: polysaccharide export protein [Caulobacteraceae bacterium]|nr:polysaccharide export protein [Caulobacteraceae bacterium]